MVGESLQRYCQYEYESWYGLDGRAYVQAVGLQYERSNAEAFATAASRRLRAVLKRDGILLPGMSLRTIGCIEEWDRSHNIADGLLETMTYRTVHPVAAAAAASA